MVKIIDQRPKQNVIKKTQKRRSVGGLSQFLQSDNGLAFMGGVTLAGIAYTLEWGAVAGTFALATAAARVLLGGARYMAVDIGGSVAEINLGMKLKEAEIQAMLMQVKNAQYELETQRQSATLDSLVKYLNVTMDTAKQQNELNAKRIETVPLDHRLLIDGEPVDADYKALALIQKRTVQKRLSDNTIGDDTQLEFATDWLKDFASEEFGFHYMINGPTGVGKTTLVFALIDALQARYNKPCQIYYLDTKGKRLPDKNVIYLKQNEDEESVRVLADFIKRCKKRKNNNANDDAIVLVIDEHDDFVNLFKDDYLRSVLTGSKVLREKDVTIILLGQSHQKENGHGLDNATKMNFAHAYLKTTGKRFLYKLKPFEMDNLQAWRVYYRQALEKEGKRVCVLMNRDEKVIPAIIPDFPTIVSRIKSAGQNEIDIKIWGTETTNTEQSTMPDDFESPPISFENTPFASFIAELDFDVLDDKIDHNTYDNPTNSQNTADLEADNTYYVIREQIINDNEMQIILDGLATKISATKIALSISGKRNQDYLFLMETVKTIKGIGDYTEKSLDELRRLVLSDEELEFILSELEKGGQSKTEIAKALVKEKCQRHNFIMGTIARLEKSGYF